MKWACVLGHVWKIKACHESVRVWIATGRQYEVTDVISVCSVCFKVKSEEIDGAVTLEELI